MRRRGTKRGCYGVMAVFWGALPLPTSPVDPMVGWEAAVVSSRRPETLVVSYGTANAHANQIFTPSRTVALPTPTRPESTPRGVLVVAGVTYRCSDRCSANNIEAGEAGLVTSAPRGGASP